MVGMSWTKWNQIKHELIVEWKIISDTRPHINRHPSIMVIGIMIEPIIIKYLFFDLIAIIKFVKASKKPSEKDIMYKNV